MDGDTSLLLLFFEIVITGVVVELERELALLDTEVNILFETRIS